MNNTPKPMALGRDGIIGVVDVEFGGWAITQQLYNLIRAMLPDGSVILEFGSGEGTIALCQNYEVHSVEHDEEWVGHSTEANYVHAPLKNSKTPVNHIWYDEEIVRAWVPSSLDLVLIDGPPGVIGRGGILFHMDSFDCSTPIIVDDAGRSEERRISNELAEELGVIPIIFTEGKRAFALLMNESDESISSDFTEALDGALHRLRIGPIADPLIADAIKSQMEDDFGWIVYTRLCANGVGAAIELVTGTFHGLSAAKKRALTLKSTNDWEVAIISEYAPPKAEIEIASEVQPNKSWRQEGTVLYLETPWTEIHFEMPEGWSLEMTHPDLLKVAEFVLLHPWVDGILDDWKPSREPGSRPGLALSGGIDSTAAMLLMPDNTALVYNERDFVSGIKHENAFRLFNHLSKEHGREVIRVKSNHETIRTNHGKAVGFSTDYACAVQVILLGDFLDLDSFATGMPLENSYLYHGYRYRDFKRSWFWRLYGALFQSIGLPIFQPVAGCSEEITNLIVQENDLIDYAQSCIRSLEPGSVCGRCWKCFRKNSMLKSNWQVGTEIDIFLRKVPLKQAAATIYSFQRMADRKGRIPKSLRPYPQVEEFWNLDLSWMDRHFPPALELLPERYRDSVEKKLAGYCEPMTEPYPIIGFDLYPNITD